MLPDVWENIHRILVIYLGNWQNFVQTIPALKKLRQFLPETGITLMVSPSTQHSGLQIPWADDVWVYEDADCQFKNAECELALIAKLHQCAFDASIIFTNPGESPYSLAYICYLAGIPIRIGQSQEFGGGVLSQWVKPKAMLNSIDHHLFLVDQLQVLKCILHS
jgi:ADP-heptose:LPS heptosyltransferase